MQGKVLAYTVTGRINGDALFGGWLGKAFQNEKGTHLGSSRHAAAVQLHRNAVGIDACPASIFLLPVPEQRTLCPRQYRCHSTNVRGAHLA